MFLSFLLNGNVPRYSTVKHGPHEDSILHARLQKLEGSPLYSAFDDPTEYTAHFASRGYSRQALPVNVLYDTLARPGADVGESGKGRIEWATSERKVPFICCGQDIGGQWAKGETGKTLSYSEMLGLPGLNIEKFLGTAGFERPWRSDVRRYLQCYPEEMGLAESIFGGVDVVHVKREGNRFRIRLRASNREHTIWSRNLVLATGVSSMPIPPPSELANLRLTPNSPVLVVGTGFSAADEVLRCLGAGQRVIHVYKWKTATSQPLKSCHPQAYPEYIRVWRLMRGRNSDPLYEGMPDGTVRYDDAGVVVEFPDERPALKRQISEFKYYIGRCSSVEYLDPELRREIGVASHIRLKTLREKCEGSLEIAPRVFAIGSLTGDSLVKFAGGGCLQVTAKILKGFEEWQKEKPKNGESPSRNWGCRIS